MVMKKWAWPVFVMQSHKLPVLLHPDASGRQTDPCLFLPSELESVSKLYGWTAQVLLALFAPLVMLGWGREGQ